MAPKPRSVLDGVISEASEVSDELLMHKRSDFPNTIHPLPDFTVREAFQFKRDVVLIKDLRWNVFFVQSHVLEEFHWRSKVEDPDVDRQVASFFVCVGYDAVDV